MFFLPKDSFVNGRVLSTCHQSTSGFFQFMNFFGPSQ
jgi:hypothetical protein